MRGGFHEAACGARVVYPRRAGFDPASGTGSERMQSRERSGVESPREPGSFRLMNSPPRMR